MRWLSHEMKSTNKIASLSHFFSGLLSCLHVNRLQISSFIEEWKSMWRMREWVRDIEREGDYLETTNVRCVVWEEIEKMRSRFKSFSCCWYFFCIATFYIHRWNAVEMSLVIVFFSRDRAFWWFHNDDNNFFSRETDTFRIS